MNQQSEKVEREGEVKPEPQEEEPIIGKDISESGQQCSWRLNNAADRSGKTKIEKHQFIFLYQSWVSSGRTF